LHQRILVGAAAVGCVALTAFACERHGDSASRSQSAASTAPTISRVPVTSPTKHWVQSQQLKGIMDQLSRQHASLPAGVPQDPESAAGRESRRAVAEAAELADLLARTADGIPAAVDTSKMSEADRRGFISEAQTLRDQADELRDAARANRVEQMQTVLDRINSTCLSCHSRYRDFAGELNFRKADAALNGNGSARAD
jgi:hypothetical protein